MDSEAVLMVIALFVVLGLAFILRYRRKSKIGIRGPWGTSFEAQGSNEPPSREPAVIVEDAKSHAGSLRATDETGRGAAVRRVEVERDLDVRSGSGPKADPPA